MRRAVAASAVYAALTCDYGMGQRDPSAQADNILDLNGLLHVKDVNAFIAALSAWQADVARASSARRGRHAARQEVLDTVAAVLSRSAGTPNRTERPLSSLGPSSSGLRRRCECGVTFIVLPQDPDKTQCTLCAAGMVRA